MQQLTYSESASITVNGITPAAGAGMILLANPSLAINSAVASDYIAETYIIGPSTTATAVDLGLITSGKMIWIQTDLPITITLTQNAVDKTFNLDSFLMINTTFTAIKVANSSSTASANISLVVVGDRTAGSGAGIY